MLLGLQFLIPGWPTLMDAFLILPGLRPTLRVVPMSGYSPTLWDPYSHMSPPAIGTWLHLALALMSNTGCFVHINAFLISHALWHPCQAVLPLWYPPYFCFGCDILTQLSTPKDVFFHPLELWTLMLSSHYLGSSFHARCVSCMALPLRLKFSERCKKGQRGKGRENRRKIRGRC